MTHITNDQFESRFVSVILSGRDMPRQAAGRHILFISASLALAPGRAYSEREIDDVLGGWCQQFGANFGLDHVSLRRYLVDEGYLRRDPAGAAYEVVTTDLPYTFDESLRALDLAALVEEAQAERERKKQEYMRKAAE